MVKVTGGYIHHTTTELYKPDEKNLIITRDAPHDVLVTLGNETTFISQIDLIKMANAILEAYDNKLYTS